MTSEKSCKRQDLSEQSTSIIARLEEQLARMERLIRNDLVEQRSKLDSQLADDGTAAARRAAAVEAARQLFSGQAAKDFAASFFRAYEEREAERQQGKGAGPADARVERRASLARRGDLSEAVQQPASSDEIPVVDKCGGRGTGSV